MGPTPDYGPIAPDLDTPKDSQRKGSRGDRSRRDRRGLPISRQHGPENSFINGHYICPRNYTYSARSVPLGDPPIAIDDHQGFRGRFLRENVLYPHLLFCSVREIVDAWFPHGTVFQPSATRSMRLFRFCSRSNRTAESFTIWLVRTCNLGCINEPSSFRSKFTDGLSFTIWLV